MKLHSSLCYLTLEELVICIFFSRSSIIGYIMFFVIFIENGGDFNFWFWSFILIVLDDLFQIISQVSPSNKSCLNCSIYFHMVVTIRLSQCYLFIWKHTLQISKFCINYDCLVWIFFFRFFHFKFFNLNNKIIWRELINLN